MIQRDSDENSLEKIEMANELDMFLEDIAYASETEKNKLAKRIERLKESKSRPSKFRRSMSVSIIFNPPPKTSPPSFQKPTFRRRSSSAPPELFNNSPKNSDDDTTNSRNSKIQQPEISDIPLPSPLLSASIFSNSPMSISGLNPEEVAQELTREEFRAFYRATKVQELTQYALLKSVSEDKTPNIYQMIQQSNKVNGIFLEFSCF